MKRILSSICLLTLFVNSNVFTQQKDTSVLADGDIYKISVSDAGVYKLDYDFFNSLPEFDINSINPRKIHIYGNPGGPVPQSLTDERVDDLADNNLYFSDNNDGSFDPGDYILFYADGPSTYSFENWRPNFLKNYYSKEHYYFIKVEASDAPIINEVNSLSNPELWSENGQTVIRHEIDRINLLANHGGAQGSGKEWYGESFGADPIQDFSSSFSFENIIPGSEAQVRAVFAGRDDRSMNYRLSIDGQQETNRISTTDLGDIDRQYAHNSVISETFILNSNKPEVTVEFLPNTSIAQGWLDHVEMTVQTKNIFNQDLLYIFDTESAVYDTYGFDIEGPNGFSLWDITDVTNVNEAKLESTGGSFRYGFETDNEVKLFLAFDKNNDWPSPTFESKINNQNLHGIQSAELLIVYHERFEAAAEALAEHRRNFSGFEVATAEIGQIYNEFSCGKVDPSAIRDIAKMIYSRDNNFKYLLLMGDASYDFRRLNSELEFQNFIPTYETNESLHPIYAFPTDDFFGLLSDAEGDDNLRGTLELGVGRIPCQTADQANNVVNKIIHYDTSANTLGEWRMRLGFSADDQDSNLHMSQADGIAERTENSHPEFVQQKVFFDAFNQVSTPGGARYPDARAAINTNLENGQLVLNYLGHGGPKGWAQERVLQINDIINWSNSDRLPLIITATCSFTGFDEPSFVSAGEHAILNPGGGAVALFTTVRAVFANNNELLTRKVFEKLFLRNGNERMRLGDILRQAQNDIAEITNKRKFLLMGDPSMELAIPKYNIKLQEFNTIDIEKTLDEIALDTSIIDPEAYPIDTIGALETVTIKGIIEDFAGIQQNDFNGTINITVFDKSNTISTLDNDEVGITFKFNARQNLLYKGTGTVNGGVFELEFILPKDIDFNFGQGMISLYASDGIKEDAGGYFKNFDIGGTSDNNIVDNDGPLIDIYLEDRQFIEGNETSASPLLIVDLEDESGINLSSTSIGHDLTARLDDADQSIVLNNFFSAAVDQIGKGTIEYQLSNLENGQHTISIKAWDILNNSSEASTSFFVAEDLEGFINNVINYPNPFVETTQFRFDHDLIGQDLDIEIDIFSDKGEYVRSLFFDTINSDGNEDFLEWQGTGNNGAELSKGIYFYKIKVTSQELDLSRESEFQKLLIIR